MPDASQERFSEHWLLRGTWHRVTLPEGWIAGRRYRLLPYAGGQETMCSECNRSVASLYMPAE